MEKLKRARKRMSEKQLWLFVRELCSAVEHMHSHRIVHRDLKSLNVFLTADGHIKIGDLGLGRLLQGDRHLMESRVGTPLYLSPELVRRQPYDYKVDVWSLGCLIYSLAALRPPFEVPFGRLRRVVMAWLAVRQCERDHPSIGRLSSYTTLPFVLCWGGVRVTTSLLWGTRLYTMHRRRCHRLTRTSCARWCRRC